MGERGVHDRGNGYAIACAAILLLLLPMTALASPAHDVAARFVDVLRRDDLSLLAQFVDTTQPDPRAWEEFRGVIDRYDCVSIGRYDSTIVSQSADRLALRLRLHGTAALKGVWRPTRRLPHSWTIEARFAAGTWRVWRAMSEERRIAMAMAAAPTAADAETIARDAVNANDVDLLEVLAFYARELESVKDTSRLEHALALAQDTADVSTQVIALRSYALTRGDPTGMLASSKRAEELARTAGSRDDLVRALLLLGNAYLGVADRDRAIETFAACAAMVDVAEDPIPAMKCQQMFIHSSWHSRSLLEVLRAAEVLAEMANRYGWEEGQELGLFNQAGIQENLGNDDVERALYEALIPLAERHGNRRFTAYAMFNLALRDKDALRYEQARTRLLALLALPAIDDRVMGEALAMLAQTHIELNQFAEAENVLERAERLAATRKLVRGTILVTRSDLQRRRGNAEEAIRLAEDALREHGASFGRSDVRRQATYVSALARALHAAERRDEAIAALRKAIAMVETAQELLDADPLGVAAFVDDYSDVYVRLVEWLVVRGEVDEAFRVAEQMKSRGLREAISRARIDLSASLPDEDRSHDRTLQRRVVEVNRAILAARQKQQATDDLEQQLAVARRDLSAFRSEMRIKHPAVARRRFDVAPTYELPAGEESLALIEYVVADDQVIAFVVRRGSPIHAVRIPIGKSSLVRDTRELESLIAARSPEYRRIATSLYATLLAPLAPHLPSAATLAIVPDGVLWNVPFHALVTPHGRHVIDRQPVFYAHSLHFLQHASTLPASGPARLFALGNPSIGAQARSTFRSVYRDNRLDTLLDAEVEVRSVSSMYPAARARVYYGDRATETAFKNEAADYSVIHIAAHAIIDDRAPLYSALVLASGSPKEDGLLEAREVADLPLDARLAVLSACETARGKIGNGEGVIGLSWAFFAAGCPTTVVSQWRAESAATAGLMIEFHRRLRAGDTTAEALRRAQMKVRSTPKYKHPFYWAPFIAVGTAYGADAP